MQPDGQTRALGAQEITSQQKKTALRRFWVKDLRRSEKSFAKKCYLVPLIAAHIMGLSCQKCAGRSGATDAKTTAMTPALLRARAAGANGCTCTTKLATTKTRAREVFVQQSLLQGRYIYIFAEPFPE